MSKPSTFEMKQEIFRVMRDSCNTAKFGVRDAFTFAGCIPNINKNITDKAKKYIDQPANVLEVFKRCREAEEAIVNDLNHMALGPRKGQGVTHPITHKEVLVNESMKKTAAVVQLDKAGVCHTLAQFAFVTLMKECQLNGRAYDDLDPEFLPSIRIVAHNPGAADPSKKLRAASTHNFIIVGYDGNEAITYHNLEKMKDKILIVDPWYFALGNEGDDWGNGIYTWDEYPHGFLQNLSCIYDNQKPFTMADLDEARTLAEGSQKSQNNAHIHPQELVDEQIKILGNQLNNLQAKLSRVEYELLELDSDNEWDEKETISSEEKEIKRKALTVDQQILKGQIKMKVTNYNRVCGDNERNSQLTWNISV